MTWNKDELKAVLENYAAGGYYIQDKKRAYLHPGTSFDILNGSAAEDRVILVSSPAIMERKRKYDQTLPVGEQPEEDLARKNPATQSQVQREEDGKIKARKAAIKEMDDRKKKGDNVKRFLNKGATNKSSER
jgi:hypothetical protein